MGLRVRRQIGPKGLKLNVGKKGYNSTSIKLAKGITYNTKRGLTLGLAGTGISYNFGRKKPRNASNRKVRRVTPTADMRARTAARREYNSKFKEFTGGYNKKSIIAIIISFVLCITPLCALGLLVSIPSLLWFIIDTSIKVIKLNKYLKEAPKSI